MQAERLAHHAPQANAARAAGDAPRREADLHGYVLAGLGALDGPVKDHDRPDTDAPDVGPGAVEEGPEQAAALEAAAPREGVEPHGLRRRAYLLAFVS